MNEAVERCWLVIGRAARHGYLTNPCTKEGNMDTNVRELSDRYNVDPTDIEAMIASYPDSELGMWPQPGVLSTTNSTEIGGRFTLTPNTLSEPSR